MRDFTANIITMNRIIKRVSFLLMRLSIMPLLIREIVQRKYVTILYYHDINPETFRLHIGYLNQKYKILSLRKFIDSIKNDKVNTLPSKSLIITFDDGYQKNYDLLPIIKFYNINPTISLVTGIINTKRHFWFNYKFSKNIIQMLLKVPDNMRLMFLNKHGFHQNK